MEIILGTALLLFAPDNKVLLTKRMKDPFKGCYAFIGGKIEIGETSKESIMRETIEEIGVELNENYVLPYGVREYITQDKHIITTYYRYYMNDNEVSKILNVEPHKHEFMDFFQLHHGVLPQPFFENTQSIYELENISYKKS